MRLLVTGAFGDLGRAVVRAALERGHWVTALDRPGRRGRRAAQRLRREAASWSGVLDVCWADVLDRAAVARAVVKQDAVFHGAAILAPASERDPERSRTVNVGGTANVLSALRAEAVRRAARGRGPGVPSAPPRILYPSSVAVYGPGAVDGPPRTAADPVRPTDHYTHHKAACEALVRDSGLEYLILRIGVALAPGAATTDPEVLRWMLRIRPENRLETVHPDDVARAVVNGLDRPAAWNRTLLIAGGPRCRIRQRDLVGTVLEAAGVGRLPDEAFGREPFYTDWMDTAEAERLLAFQRYGFDDFCRDSRVAFRGLRLVMRPVAPAARWLLRRTFGPRSHSSKEHP